jgi:hypothetical protein
MKELYGVLGAGTAPEKVITASLNDVGTKVHYMVPWYGRPTPGLETVYDWVLDNDASFTVVGAETIPQALTDAAEDFVYAKDVNAYIFDELTACDPSGMSMILWDTEREEISLSIATQSIDKGLPTMDLTNGLVPIIFEDEPAENSAPVVTEELEEDPTQDVPTTSFTKDELETMPASSVKRMARDLGFEAKTKGEAIDYLSGTSAEHMVVSTYSDQVPKPVEEKKVKAITLHYSDGSTSQHFFKED